MCSLRKLSLLLLLLIGATITAQTDSLSSTPDSLGSNPNVSPFSNAKKNTTKESKRKYPFPNNIVDLSLGAGPNYGLFGTKTVIGYKGNGFLLGLGLFDGSFAYQVGVQGCYKWFYANFCFGTVAAAYQRSSSIPELLSAPVLSGGLRANLLRNKKMFFDIGYGYAFGPFYKIGPYTENLGGPRLLLGLGFRLFDQRKKAGNDDPAKIKTP